MRKALPILALLSFAAASSAQMFTLSPVATSGYSFHNSYILEAENNTYAYRNTYYPSPYSGPVVTRYEVGWRAEFALPAAPSGTRLVSAFLETRVAGSTRSGFQNIWLNAYAGSGTISAARPASAVLVSSRSVSNASTLRVDVAAGVGPGPYAGVDMVCQPLPLGQDGATPNFSWSAPTLAVTYAPVPEPSAFAALSIGALAMLRRRKRA